MYYKNAFFYVIAIFLGVIILNLWSTTLIEVSEKIAKLDTEHIYILHLYQSFYGLIIGVLAKTGDLIKLINKEKYFRPSPRLISGVIMLLISFIPKTIILLNVGSLNMPFPIGSVGINMLIGPLVWGPTQHVLSVIAGIFIIEGLTETKKNF